VAVDELMTLERYSHVMHMTSQVSGRLRPGCTPVDVIRATLPAGTVSGAPKVRAMQIIDELEVRKRGVYAGVVGYLDFSGNLDMALAIRTMVVVDGVGSVQAGAGSWPTATRSTRSSSATTRRPPSSQRAGGEADDGGAAGGDGRGGAVSASGGAGHAAAAAWGVPLARDVVLASGPDAVTYLQGQLSQDVAALGQGDSTWSLLLTPQGHLVALLRVTRTEADAFALDTDAGAGPDVLARLQRFLLRTRCELAQVPWTCLAVRGPGAVAPASGPATRGWSCRRPRERRLRPARPRRGAAGGVEPGDPAAYEALRIERGVPRMGSELGERTIPPRPASSTGRPASRRGCYTGQELVARIDSRGGNVPRRLRGLVLAAGADVPPPGAVVAVGDQEVGAVTSAAWSATRGAPVALAYARRGTDVPASCTVGWDATVAPATLSELPLA
jgi:folate-binding protein YgfZ